MNKENSNKEKLETENLDMGKGGIEVSDSKKPGRYAEFLADMKEDKAKKYIVSRIIGQIDYYSKRSQQYQKRYYVLSIASVCLNAAIPIFVLLGNIEHISFLVKVVIALLSALAGIFASIVTFRNYRELWVQYRVSCESLKAVMDRYFLGVAEFRDKGDDEKLEILESICSDIMYKEHGLWKQLKMKEDNGDQKS